MNTSTYGKHLINRTLNALALKTAAALISLGCCTVFAQTPQPSPTPGDERQKTSQVGPAQAQALEQLARGIEGLEFDLPKVRERFGANDPRAAHLEKELAKLRELQSRFLRTMRGESSEGTMAEASRLMGEISAATAIKPPESSSNQLAGVQQELQQMKQHLAEREKQLATVLAEQRRPPLPPLENGTLKIYRFVYADSHNAAKTVESLFGTQSVRVSVDDRNNLLIAYGKPEVVTALDALLSRFDEQASPDGYKKSTQGMASPRSLLLRVFWLADNLPESAGQNPTEFLPKSVLDATHKLGLEAPRLVTQTVNSLATGKDDAVDFSTNVPALLMDQPVGMGCEGKLKLVADDRVRVDMEVHVGGQTMNCDLRGSMATPLGHYMVLGTANSMIAEGAPVAGVAPAGPGMGRGRGPMGAEGRTGPGGFRGAEGGAPGFGAAAPGAAGPGGEFAGPGADPNPGPGGATGAPVAKQKFETSRFAFVVQVIEGQSYGAEKGNADRFVDPASE